MSIMKRAMDFLGLGPDDSYDDYDMPAEPERASRQPRPHREFENQRSGRGGDFLDAEVDRQPPQRPSFPRRDDNLAPARRPQAPSDDSSVHPRPTSPKPGGTVAVRPRGGSPTEPATVKPRRFDQAQEIADRFKDGLPVIMNLEGAEREVTRRLIDFASGLCYGLNGSMEKVASGVYLLKPQRARPATTTTTAAETTTLGA